jgi:glycosyltransferase involved in cell wall biosynthesis
MNMLFAIHYPFFGGPHNQALRLNALLAGAGWHTVVLLPDESGGAAERLLAGGVEVVQQTLHRLRANPDPRLQAKFVCSFAGDVARIRHLIRSRNIDLVVVAGLANPHAAVAARREGVPVVWQILDTHTPPVIRFLLMGVVRRLADAVMFDGETLIRLHAPISDLPLPKFVYFPPVDTANFYPSPDRRLTTRRELGIPDDALVVGMVANIAPQKGIEYFIRAASIIQRRMPEAWFLMVGARFDSQPEYAKRIQREIARSGVEGRIIVAGPRADVERYYPAMDVKLITSVPRSEGTTTTAMEALACGVPVVATDVGAIKEVVTDQVTGLLVRPRDPQALADATCLLLRDAPRRSEMGRLGRQHAVERYASEICADVHLQAFQAAMLQHRQRRRPREEVIAS